MAMAMTVGQFLNSHNVDFSLTHHRHTDTSFSSAVSAHVPTSQVAKAVLLKDQQGDYLMAVVPSNRRVMIDKINRIMGKQFFLVGEHELTQIFQDCEPGAIPSLGQAYKINMLVDDLLLEQDELYIESGDHENLIHLDNKQFHKVMRDVPHRNISGYRMLFTQEHDGRHWEWE
ncbi:MULTISPECIES: aminoacyl-tRNA deacylase [Photobacterium]|uniref:Deacylase n=2 Tax=Photobacterium halotolerans TaxID=265726 RepID=A0A0F5VAD9_9GAMM|nr:MULTISPECIES: YbaK/EbsC family protein [Photobacterium]KKC99125.1 prolyl-tRNA synthetase [Photobacterium halotolerans]NAW63870.1 deacylase [Photobacterium halotolerans]NAW88025.1 deacylase [Photobacterium halotolerans]NAX46066.1 deacylase [Photobacterium halotolerans]UIP30076.1 YbaK/EbsC family protein [Photobacterium sp. TLY01]